MYKRPALQAGRFCYMLIDKISRKIQSTGMVFLNFGI